MAEGAEQEDPQRDDKRREFLRSAVRWPLVAALGLLAGRLMTRRGPLSAGETCTNRGACRGCSALAKCGLPQATMARRAPY